MFSSFDVIHLGIELVDGDGESVESREESCVLCLLVQEQRKKRGRTKIDYPKTTARRKHQR